MKRVKYIVGAFAASVALILGVAAPKMVGAQIVQPEKVFICHRTNSASNPYVKIEVSVSAVDGVAGNSGNEADHYGEHKGPLASSEQFAAQLKKDKIDWGDIIPPVEGTHQGLNYAGLGYEMLQNDCNYTKQEPVAICNSLTATKVSRTEFQFSVDATANNGYLVDSYDYDFGDGNTEEGGTNPINHIYVNAGTYNVKVLVNFAVEGEKDLNPTTNSCETTVTVDAEGQVLGTQTPTQVTSTPVSGVSAGAGGASGTSTIVAVGLIGSILTLAIGLVRKFNA